MLAGLDLCSVCGGGIESAGYELVREIVFLSIFAPPPHSDGVCWFFL
jgi:hypothetical protein